MIGGLVEGALAGGGAGLGLLVAAGTTIVRTTTSGGGGGTGVNRRMTKPSSGWIGIAAVVVVVDAGSWTG